MTDLSKTKLDAPWKRGKHGWDLYIPEGSVLEYGHSFDPERGYRVALGFKGSYAKNTIDPVDAHKMAREQLDREDPDQKHLSDTILKMARQCERLNLGWIAAGRPSRALDKEIAGHA